MIRVLVADDQALVRGAIVTLLGLEPDVEVVAEAGRGDEVLPLLVEHEVDVALVDVEMPGLDGIEVCRAITAAGLPTRALVVTTFGRPGFVRRALEAGAAGFVVKDTPASEPGRRGAACPRRGACRRRRARGGVAHRRSEPAHRQGAGRAPGGAERCTHRRGREDGAPVGGDGAQPPVVGDGQDAHVHPG